MPGFFVFEKELFLEREWGRIGLTCEMACLMSPIIAIIRFLLFVDEPA